MLKRKRRFAPIVRTCGGLWDNEIKMPSHDDEDILKATPAHLKETPAHLKATPKHGCNTKRDVSQLKKKQSPISRINSHSIDFTANKTNVFTCDKIHASEVSSTRQVPPSIPRHSALEHLHPSSISKALVDTCRPRTPMEIIGMERQIGDFMRWVGLRVIPPDTTAALPIHAAEVHAKQKSRDNGVDGVDGVNGVSGKQKYVCMLSGPPGVGKTTAAYVVAASYNIRVIELDASSERTTANLRKYIREICSLRSSDGRRQMLLIEEIDGAYDQAQTNIVDILLENIQEYCHAPHFPVIVATCNNAMQRVLKKLRSSALTIAFGRLKAADANKLITRCLSSIDIPPTLVTPDQRASIVRSGSGDARQILYSLEMFALLRGTCAINSHVDRTFTSRYDVVAVMITKRPDMWMDLEHNICNGEPFVDILRHNLLRNVNNFSYLNVVPRPSSSGSTSLPPSQFLQSSTTTTTTTTTCPKMCMEAISDTLDDIADAALMMDRAYLNREDDTTDSIAANILICSFDANGPSMFKNFGQTRDHYPQPDSFSYPRVVTHASSFKQVRAFQNGQDMMTKTMKK